jgi:hypothetical protein
MKALTNALKALSADFMGLFSSPAKFPMHIGAAMSIDKMMRDCTTTKLELPTMSATRIRDKALAVKHLMDSQKMDEKEARNHFSLLSGKKQRQLISTMKSDPKWRKL